MKVEIKQDYDGKLFVIVPEEIKDKLKMKKDDILHVELKDGKIYYGKVSSC